MEANPDALYCAFTNGFGAAHRDPEVQYRCAHAAIEDNPENEPSKTAIATTADFLATHTNLSNKSIDRAALILNVSRRWRNGRTIRVGFLNGPEWARAQVLEIAQRWTRYANLELVLETNVAAAEIRVNLQPTSQSWSMLGNGALGVRTGPTMELGWYVAHPGDGVVLHEFGHGAIAAPHEQFHPQRHCEYDRAAVIRSLSGPPNNWSLAQIETNVLRPPWSGDTFTPYDVESIMHYGQPQSWFITPGCGVEPNHRLSQLDKKGAATWYPKPVMSRAVDVVVKAQDTPIVPT